MLKDDKIPDDLLVLSCEEDYSICIPLLEKGNNAFLCFIQTQIFENKRHSMHLWYLVVSGAEIFSSELLLNGIVIQKLEYERLAMCPFKRLIRNPYSDKFNMFQFSICRHRLFLDHVRRTRSTIWLREEDGDRFLPVAKCT